MAEGVPRKLPKAGHQAAASLACAPAANPLPHTGRGGRMAAYFVSASVYG
jgi:hypothetical protein